MTDNLDWITIPTIFLVVIIVVLTHYEGLHFFTRWISRNTLKPRFRIALMIYGLLVLHGIEIVFFGATYWILRSWSELGTLLPLDPVDFVDYIYFSATVYSTLGFGDLVPTGSLRLIAGIESVTGLLLITWSASFTYLEMVRYWRDSD